MVPLPERKPVLLNSIPVTQAILSGTCARYDSTPTVKELVLAQAMSDKRDLWRVAQLWDTRPA